MAAVNQHFPECSFFEKQTEVYDRRLTLFRLGGVILPLPTHNRVKSERIEILPLFFFKLQAKGDLSLWEFLNLIDPGFRQELEKQNGRHKSTIPRMQRFGKKTVVYDRQLTLFRVGGNFTPPHP